MESAFLSAPVRAVKHASVCKGRRRLVVGRGNLVLIYAREPQSQLLFSQRLPVAEVITGLFSTEEGDSVYVSTEFCVFYLHQDVAKGYAFTRLPITTRDRILTVFPTASLLLVVSARGILHLFRESQHAGGEIYFHFLKMLPLTPSAGLFYSACIRSLPCSQAVLIALGTIFSGIVIVRANPAELSVEHLKALSAHKGTIFDLKWASTGTLVSCSDDRSLCIWNHSGFSLDQMIKNAHDSRIWQIALSDSNPLEIVSVGEDGRCKVWSGEGLLLAAYEGVGACKNIVSADICGSALAFGADDGSVVAVSRDRGSKCAQYNGYSVAEHGRLQSLCLSGLGKLAVTTEKGLHLELSHDGHVRSTKVGEPGTYSIAASCSNSETIISNREALYKVASVEKIKVAEFNSHEHCTAFFAVKVGIWSFVVELGGRNPCLVSSARQLSLKYNFQMCGRITVTGTDGERLLVGTRKGYLIEFNVCTGEPIATIRVNTASDSVRSIRILKDKDELSVADHGFNIHRYSFTDFTFLGRMRIAHGTLERAFSLDDRDYAVGFSGDELVIWEVRTDTILERIKCGGGHRLWDFYCAEDGAFEFAFMSENVIRAHSGSLKARAHLDGHVHGEEVRALHALAESEKGLVVTGGEDGLLVVWSASSSGALTEMTRYCTREPIKTITSCRKKQGGWFLFAGGAKESISALFLDDNGVNLRLLLACPKAALVPETRIMSLDATAVPECTSKTTDLLGEVDLPRTTSSAFVLAAYSDGSVRLWKFSLIGSTPSFTLLSFKSDPHPRRIALQARFTKIKSSALAEFVTGGTDGRLCLWRHNAGQMSLVDSCEIHQSAVCTVNVRGEALITGGEDGLVALVSLCEEKLSVLAQVPCAHSSAVAGVTLHPNGSTAHTSGPDGRVCTFSYSIQEQRLQLSRVTRSCIADIAGIALLRECTVLVGGVGLETFSTADSSETDSE